jgi:GTP cyclohydrolase I
MDMALTATNLKSALFTEDHRQMIVVKDIEVYSMCEHHMLPFSEKHMSPIFRMERLWDLVKFQNCGCFCQKNASTRLTDQIKDCIQEALNPLGDSSN